MLRAPNTTTYNFLTFFVSTRKTNMKKYLLSFVVISLMLLNLGCKKSPTEPNTTAALSVEDISCTEAWVKITTTNYQTPNTLTLFVNDKADQNITLASSDTLLYVDSLLPNQSYKIKAAFANNNQLQTTNEVIAKTMDTPSHNFTWQTFNFGGDGGSSFLSDISIINENNIWAVGAIYTKDSYTYDSLGKWIDPYNAIHWNGSDWELKRIYYNYNGSLLWGLINSVFAFSDNDIWFGTNIHWNGKVFEQPNASAQSGLSVNKMWGTSSSDLYAVGYEGGIAHYDGKSWQKIESGTTLNINDIWGDFNRRTQEWEILAVAADKFFNEGSSVLKIEKMRAKEINKTGLPWSLSSVWFHSSKNYFIGGDGLFSNKKINNDWGKVTDLPTFYKDRIRGVESNDIVVSGSNGLLSHFNGYSWHHYLNNELPYFTGRLLSVEVKNNIIVATGWKEQGSIIILGKR